MKIKRITVYPLNATWEKYFGGADKVPKNFSTPSSNFLYMPRLGQHTTLVEIEAENGVKGYGECFGLPNALYSAAYVKDIFAPSLIGHDFDDIEKIWSRMIHIASGIGNTSGPMMEALSGIDVALWDLKGKVQGVPVYQMLGGPHFDKICCYGTPVMLFDNPKDTQSRAQELVDFGFKAIKLKMGRTVDIDLQHIDAVRSQVGKDIQLLLDMNCGYEGRTNEAISFAKELIPYDIYWFEEPVSPENIEAYQKIRKATDLLLATGENDFTLAQFKRITDSGAIDVVMPNSGRAGGITGIMKIASYAEKKGVKLSPHGVGSGVSILASLHAMQACTNSSLFEYNQFLNPLRLGIMKNEINFADSQIVMNNNPGLGIDINWETVLKYTDDKWEQ